MFGTFRRTASAIARRSSDSFASVVSKGMPRSVKPLELGSVATRRIVRKTSPVRRAVFARSRRCGCDLDIPVLTLVLVLPIRNAAAPQGVNVVAKPGDEALDPLLFSPIADVLMIRDRHLVMILGRVR